MELHACKYDAARWRAEVPPPSAVEPILRPIHQVGIWSIQTTIAFLVLLAIWRTPDPGLGQWLQTFFLVIVWRIALRFGRGRNTLMRVMRCWWPVIIELPFQGIGLFLAATFAHAQAGFALIFLILWLIGEIMYSLVWDAFWIRLNRSWQDRAMQVARAEHRRYQADPSLLRGHDLLLAYWLRLRHSADPDRERLQQIWDLGNLYCQLIGNRCDRRAITQGLASDDDYEEYFDFLAMPRP